MNRTNIAQINGVALTSLAVLALDAIKANPTFPYRTGHLRNDATYIGTDGFEIVFDSGDGRASSGFAMRGAPYIPFLEYGTVKSTKHVGFIRVRALDDATRAIAEAIGGVIVS